MAMVNPWDLEYESAPAQAPWDMQWDQPRDEATPAAPAQQYVGPWRGAALGGQAVVQGLTGLAGMPGNFERLGTRFIENPVRAALGVAPATGYSLPSSGDLEGITDRLGLTGHPNLQPSTPVERLGTALIRGTTGGAVGSAIGLGGSILPMALVGGASDVAAQGTKEVLGQDVNPLIPMGVGLGTGLLAAGPVARLDAGAARREAEAAAETATGAQRDIARAALYAPGDLADATKARVAEATALRDRAVAQSAGHLATQEGTANGLIANTRAGLTGLPPLAPQEAGEALQTAGRNWFEGLPDRMRQVWSPVDQTIPADTVVTPGNFVQELERTTRRASNPVWQEGLNMLQARLPQNLQGMLERVQEQGGSIPTMTWGDARAYRDALGDALANKGLVKDATQKQLSGLYRSVMEDMRGAASGLPDVTIGAGGIGVPVSPAVLFDQANAEATRLHSFIEGPLRKVITSPDAVGEKLPGEKVIGDLLAGGRAGASSLGPLAQELGPDFIRPLLSAHLAPGTGGGKELPTWDKMSDAAKVALVPDQAARQNLDMAHGLLADAQAAHKGTVETAQTQFAQAKLSASEQEDAARRALTIRKGEAGFAAADARNALAKLSDSAQSRLAQHPWERLFVGEALGQGLEPLLHTGNPLISAGLGGITAYALPWAIRNTLGTAATPGAWPYLAAGAIGAAQGGKNSLTGSSSPTALDLGPAGPSGP